MLPEVDALPGAEVEPTVGDRHRERRRREHAAHVRRHVVRTFGRVTEERVSVGHEARAYWSAYAVSKAALEMIAKIYAEETVTTNVKVNILNPGATRTNMRARAFPGEDPDTVKAPESIADDFLRLIEPACTFHGETITAQPTPA